MPTPQQEFEYMAQLQKERAKTNKEQSYNTFSGQEGEQLSNEEIDEFKISKPDIPSFPFIIFFLAILKDILDFAELTIIGIIISWIITIIFVIIVFFWTLKKVGFIRKFIIKRLVLMAAVALIPIVGLIPEASIFILWMHFREVKYVGDVLKLLEEAEGAK